MSTNYVFSINHPELLEGEMWIGDSTEERFHSIGWKTKRMGNQAYDLEGNEVYGRYPVFIEREERVRCGGIPANYKLPTPDQKCQQ